MEMTQKLRDTWHAALNHEWYDFLTGHEIVPLSCHGSVPDTAEFDLVILAGGNDMPGIRTWRDNHYPLRDQFEYDLIQACQHNRTPIMGVCRGKHFLNYVQGGTHCLMTDPYDNRLIKLEPFEVTCHHSICTDQVAPGFDILAKDSQGIVELIINKQQRQLGVGWHPERAVNAHTRSYILDLIHSL